MSRLRSLSRGWLYLFLAPFALPQSLAIAEPPRCTQDPLCSSSVDRGVELDLAGKYEPALREFQAAYRRQRDPRVALNIGRTLHKLGRFSDALSWYKNAGRAAPYDTELQQQLQEFTAQAKQNLAEPAAAHSPSSVVNQPAFTVQTSPIKLTAALTTINNNVIKLDPESHRAQPLPASKPGYRRPALLWLPFAGAVLAASAAGIAAASWPHPWQPDPQVPTSVFSAITVGGAK